VAAIKAVNGTTYEYGTTADILYTMGGGAIDYTRAVLNISYSFALELRPKWRTLNGFNLPQDQIEAAASEAWAGILVVLERVASGQCSIYWQIRGENFNMPLCLYVALYTIVNVYRDHH
jgi:hypothetical protein